MTVFQSFPPGLLKEHFAGTKFYVSLSFVVTKTPTPLVDCVFCFTYLFVFMIENLMNTDTKSEVSVICWRRGRDWTEQNQVSVFRESSR